MVNCYVGRLLCITLSYTLLVHLMKESIDNTPLPHLPQFQIQTGTKLTRRFQREAWTSWGGWNHLICKAGRALAPGAWMYSRGVWYRHFIDFWRVAHDFLPSRDPKARLGSLFFLFTYQRHGLVLSKKLTSRTWRSTMFLIGWPARPPPSGNNARSRSARRAGQLNFDPHSSNEFD